MLPTRQGAQCASRGC